MFTNKKLTSYNLWILLVLPQGFSGKESACNEGDTGLIPGSGRSLGEGTGNLVQYSCLENPTDRGAWQATPHEVTKSQTQLSYWAHIDTLQSLKRIRQVCSNYREKSKDNKQEEKKQGMCGMLAFVFKQSCKTTWNIWLYYFWKDSKETGTRNHLWRKEVAEWGKGKRKTYFLLFITFGFSTSTFTINGEREQ